MTDEQRWGHIELNVNAAETRTPVVPDDETPFRILVLGDFSGRGSRSTVREPLVKRRTIRVDRDDLDDALAGLEPEIVLQRTSGEPAVVRIRRLDDFHPDRLYDALPIFQSLRDLRVRLANPSTFADAARELLGESGIASVTAPPDSAPARVAPGHVLDAILGEPLDSPAETAPADELQELIRRSIAPHLVPNDDPRRAPLIERVDGLIAEQMRAVLHDRTFQSLEAAWRGVTMLTRQLDTDAHLQIHLLDVSIPELIDSAASADPPPLPEHSALSRVIVDRSAGTPGGEPWALLVGAYTFGWDDADLLVLGALASIARRAGAPFIAGAAPRLVGTPSFDRVSDVDDWSRDAIPAWEELRRSPDAPYVGVVAPRFLARLPYGQDGEPCDQFDFEELGPAPRHADFLWANAAFACALLLGQSFTAAGWQLRPGMRRELDHLPYYTVHRGDDDHLEPSAEILLTERAANRMMDRGVMPLASIKDRDAALLVRFQSIAHPLTALAGRWAAGA